MGLGLSRASIDALGRRLAAATAPAPNDLATLAAIQRERSGALDAVADVLRRAFGTPARFGRTPLLVALRIKTPRAVIDELKRKVALSAIDDLVGLRIVARMNLKEQDALTAKILELLPDSKVIDLRRRPSSGYRAVHVVARYSGVPVELQLRTRAQHVWAEATERLADDWGHAILRGRPPAGRGASEVASRAEALERWELAAADIAKLEQEAMRLTDELSSRIQEAMRTDPTLRPQDAAARIVAEDPSLPASLSGTTTAIGATFRAAGAAITGL